MEQRLSLNKSKRLLTDKELNYYLELKTDQQKKKYLDSLKDELWKQIEKKN